MPTFENLRISLALPGKPPMLEMMEPTRPMSRRAYLERAFGEDRDFWIDGKKAFRFVPIKVPGGEYIAGFFGKNVEIPSFKKSDLSAQTLDGWDRAVFVLHLGKDQVAWMERSYRVGSPRKVLQSFLKAIRVEKGFQDYAPHVEYIGEVSTYWQTIEKYAGRINKVEFTFIPPNALGADTSVMDFIREASAEANSSLIKHTYENEECKLNPKADLLKESAELALAGGGEIQVQAKKKTVFTSNDSVRTAVVPKKEIPEENDVKSLLLLIGRLFGNRDD